MSNNTDIPSLLSCCIHYGYCFHIEDESQIRDALSLNDILPEPLLVVSLLPNLSMDDPFGIKDPNIVIGVIVDEEMDIDTLIKHRIVIDEFVSGSPFLEGFNLGHVPRFYSGFPWSVNNHSSDEETESDDPEISEDSSSYSSQEYEDEQDDEQKHQLDHDIDLME